MRRAYLYTLLVVATWGTSLPVNKSLLLAERGGVRLTPLQVAFWAIGVGWVTLLVVLAARGRLGRVRDISARGWVVLGAMGFFGWAGYAVALNYAFVHLALPDAVVINYLHPVFVVVFQGAVFGSVVRLVSGWEQAEDRPARRSPAQIAVGLAVCLLGVAVIATEGRLSRLGGVGSNVGALAALFAAFSWGVYSNLARFVAVRPGCEARGLGDVQTWLAMTFGVAMMGLGLLAAGEMRVPMGYVTRLYLGGPGPTGVGAWALIVPMGVVVYCGGYTLWLLALELGREAGGRIGCRR